MPEESDGSSSDPINSEEERQRKLERDKSREKLVQSLMKGSSDTISNYSGRSLGRSVSLTSNHGKKKKVDPISALQNQKNIQKF